MRPDHLRPSAQVAAVVAGEGPIGAAPAGPWQQHSGGTRACGVGTSARELPGRGALGQPDQIVSPTRCRGACPQPVPTQRGSAKLCVSDWTTLWLGLAPGSSGDTFLSSWCERVCAGVGLPSWQRT